MNYENREIAVYVAYKGVIELIKSGKSHHLKGDLEQSVRSHFEILLRICETKATENQLSYILNLLETCTLEPQHVANYRHEVRRGMSYIEFVELFKILKENQIHREGSMKQINDDIEREVEKDDYKDSKKT